MNQITLMLHFKLSLYKNINNCTWKYCLKILLTHAKQMYIGVRLDYDGDVSNF